MGDNLEMVNDPYQSDEKTLKTVKQIASRRALDTVIALNLPREIHLTGDVSFLGQTTIRFVMSKLDRLTEECGPRLPFVLALAQAHYWYAAWSNAYWLEEALVRGLVGDTDYVKAMCTAEGYIRIDGGAYTMFSTLASMDLSEHRNRLLALFNVPESPSDQCLLRSLACAFFYQANDLMKHGEIARAMDLICEAHDALALENGLAMWDGAEECLKDQMVTNGEIINSVRTSLARSAVAAKLKNDPKQREKAFIRECWNEWKNDLERYGSQAAFARDMLSKCEHILSQKTIEDWCRDWGRDALP